MLLTGAFSVETAAGILLEKTKGVFAITIGKEGTMLGFDNTTTIIPGIPVNPVDTTGAGDAFVGAVLYQLSSYTVQEMKNLSAGNWNKIIFNANKAGARTCEYLGAMEAFKHLSSAIFK